MSLLALLPSPLLGSAVWQPVAAVLRDLGWSALAVDVSGPAPGSADEALQAFLRAMPVDKDVVLVPHSNAGLFAPAIAAARPVVATVMVDAALPTTDGGSAATAPREFYDFLASKADADGVLPRWIDWWEEDDVSRLIPDTEILGPIEAQQRRLPLAYFRDSVPVPRGWHRRPHAYLAFGETYQPETDLARQLGWPVQVLDGEHLEMVVDPDVVGEAIVGLLEELVR